MKEKKIVYIAHALAGPDFKSNVESAKAWARWAITQKGVIPLTPYLSMIQYLDNDVQEERALGHKADLCLIEVCDELWICGPTPGESSFVWTEKELAETLRIPVVDFSGLILKEDS